MTALSQKLQEAFARHQAGEIGAATALYRAVLVEQPEQPDAIHMLGVIALQQGNDELALKLIEAALAKNPELALAWSNRALVLRVQGKFDEALASVLQATKLDPNLVDAWDLAGTLLWAADRNEEARDCFHKVIAIQPDNIRALTNYAALLLAMGQLQEAHKVARRAQKLDPAFVPVTLGNILKAAGYPEKAAPLFKNAYDLMPHINETRVNEAISLLQIGDMERGWELWEMRPDLEALQSIPLWRGEAVDHLLLYEFQGMGDALQCVRYLPMLRDRAKQITLQLTEPLRQLLAGQFPNVSVITLEDSVPSVTARAQLMSLPYHCKTRIDNIPAAIPYLRNPEDRRAFWADQLKDVAHPRIGLVWGGNPGHRNDANRSIPLSELSSLIQMAPDHFVSLQKGREAECAELRSYGAFDAAPFLNNFGDTAGVLQELDLLISVDTSVLHLAGALGRPVWMLTPFDPDWRWLLGREDSPWYPTLRLFRQTKPHEWSPVISRIDVELQKYLNGDVSVLSPVSWHGAPLRQNPCAIVLDEIDTP